MEMKLVAAFLFLVSTILIAIPAYAQTASTGALTVTVSDPSGAAIGGAKVTVTSSAGEARDLVTGADGSCTFTLLQVGTYQVTISAQGFQTATVDSVTVNVAETHVLKQAMVI